MTFYSLRLELIKRGQPHYVQWLVYTLGIPSIQVHLATALLSLSELQLICLWFSCHMAHSINSMVHCTVLYYKCLEAHSQRQHMQEFTNELLMGVI